MQTETTEVSITARAAKRVAEILQKEQTGSMLRVSVKGGGCSGFQYAFDIDRTPTDDDLTVTRDGVVVLVDNVSLPFLSGSEIDFVDDLMGQSFRVQNPNATAGCGCGTSFSV